jgi:hypothetical protein
MENVSQLVGMIQGGAGGLVVGVMFFAYIFRKLQHCELQHQRVVRALLAIAEQTPKITAVDVARIIEPGKTDGAGA